MGNTIRRQPVNFSIPSSPEYKFLNITNFKGLHVTDNPFTGDSNTASDLLNVYVDEQNTLTTRPRLQKTFDLPNVDRVFKAFRLTKKDVFHCESNGKVVLKIVEHETMRPVDVDTTTNNIVLTADYCCVFEKDDNIYFLNNGNFCVIKADNIAYFVKNDSDTYIPIAFTGRNKDGEIVKEPKEAVNVLNNKVKTEYFWDVSQDLSAVIAPSSDVTNNYVFKYILDDESYLSNDTRNQVGTDAGGVLNQNELVMYSTTDLRPYTPTITITSKSTNGEVVTINATYSPEYLSVLRKGYQLIADDGSSCFVYSVNENSLVLKTIVNSAFANAENGAQVTATMLEKEYYRYSFTVRDNEIKTKKGYGLVVHTTTRPAYSADGDSCLVVSEDKKMAYIVDENDSFTGRLVFGTDNTDVLWSHFIGNDILVLVEKNDKIVLETYSSSDEVNSFYYKKTQSVELDVTRYSINRIQHRVSLGDGSMLVYIPNADHKLFKIDNVYGEQKATTIDCPGIDLRGFYDILLSPSTKSFTIFEYHEKIKTYSIGDDNVAYATSSHTTQNGILNYCYTDNDNLLVLTGEWELYHVTPSSNGFYCVGGIPKPDDYQTNSAQMIMSNNGKLIIQKYSSTEASSIHSGKATRFSVQGIRKTEYPELIATESHTNAATFSATNMFRFQNNFWYYGDGNKLWWTNNNNPTYVGEYNIDAVGDANDTITDAVVVSYDVATVFKKDTMYVVSPIDSDSIHKLYNIVNAKATVGVDAPHTALITPLNEIPMFVNKKGVYGLQQLQNVQSSQNISVLASETINPKWLALSDLSNLWTLSKLYWSFFVLPRESTTQIFLLDDRTNSWYYWTLPVCAVSGWVTDERMFVVDDGGVVYVLETTDIINEFNPDVTEYYDDGKKIIPWFWKTQVLSLGTINYSKKLIDTTFVVADTDMSDGYGLNYSFTAYRKMLSETAPTTISSKLNYVQSTTKRTLIPRFNFLQLKISNVEDDVNDNKLRLIGLGLKYVLLEGLLR